MQDDVISLEKLRNALKGRQIIGIYQLWQAFCIKHLQSNNTRTTHGGHGAFKWGRVYRAHEKRPYERTPLVIFLTLSINFF